MESEDELNQKHKRERKELQAQIQVLKKSICKGDKKKKKEISETITKLEMDLDKKHNEEITNFKLSQVTIDSGLNVTEKISFVIDEDEENNAESNTTRKISKAQRRRDKKAKEDQERHKRILEEEEQNKFGKKNKELQEIEKILLKRNLMLFDIPSDGNCLYNAIIHQLNRINVHQTNVQELRALTATFLRNNMNHFLPFLTNPDSDGFLSPEEFEKYCKNISNTAAWGGDVELQVLCRALGCPIEVIQAVGAPYIVGKNYNESRKIILTYHRYMYDFGEHYNSVTTYTKSEEHNGFEG